MLEARLRQSKLKFFKSFRHFSTLKLLQILLFSKSADVNGLQGKVVNILTNDLGKFHEALLFMHIIWQGPFELALVAFLAYREIGVFGFVGIVFIISFVPINAFIGKLAATFREKTAERTDIRAKLMSEIINGIQIIKFYVWEENFAKAIAKVRAKELRAIKGTSYITAFLYAMWAVSRVSLFLSLITYVMSGNVLTARKVFVVASLYKSLNQSMVRLNAN
jgi:ATP-binding cassette, subfamily C (CFTR/MRP), member 4